MHCNWTSLISMYNFPKQWVADYRGLFCKKKYKLLAIYYFYKTLILHVWQGSDLAIYYFYKTLILHVWQVSEYLICLMVTFDICQTDKYDLLWSHTWKVNIQANKRLKVKKKKINYWIWYFWFLIFSVQCSRQKVS